MIPSRSARPARTWRPPLCQDLLDAGRAGAALLHPQSFAGDPGDLRQPGAGRAGGAVGLAGMRTSGLRPARHRLSRSWRSATAGMWWPPSPTPAASACWAPAATRPEQLDVELRWIDEHTAGRPYGADILVPAKVVGRRRAPVGCRAGAHGARRPSPVRRLPARVARRVPGRRRGGGDAVPAGWACSKLADELLDVAFAHPIKLIANALGPPPASHDGAGPSRGGAGGGPGGGQGARRAPAQCRSRHDRGAGQRSGRTHGHVSRRWSCCRKFWTWWPAGYPCWPRAASSTAPRWRRP